MTPAYLARSLYSTLLLAEIMRSPHASKSETCVNDMKLTRMLQPYIIQNDSDLSKKNEDISNFYSMRLESKYINS